MYKAHTHCMIESNWCKIKFQQKHYTFTISKIHAHTSYAHTYDEHAYLQLTYKSSQCHYYICVLVTCSQQLTSYKEGSMRCFTSHPSASVVVDGNCSGTQACRTGTVFVHVRHRTSFVR